MALENQWCDSFAEQLEDAELQAYDVTMITADYPDLDWDDAYAIQDEIRRREEDPGQQDHRPQGRPDLVRQDEADGRRDAGLRLHGELHGQARRRGDQDQRIDPPEGRGRDLHRH